MNHSLTSTDALFGLYGAGGFAREVLPIARKTGFIETVLIETKTPGGTVNGTMLVDEDSFFATPTAQRLFNIAIADGRARQKIAERMIARGAKPRSLVAESATILDDNAIGEGAILCAMTCITSNARIGRFFHANLFSYVAHDCVIGDYVTFAPRVCCNGNVRIEDHAYIGTGAVLRQGSPEKPLVIGAGAIVGMGAVVTRDVPAGATVIGNPARLMERG